MAKLRIVLTFGRAIFQGEQTVCCVGASEKKVKVLLLSNTHANGK